MTRIKVINFKKSTGRLKEIYSDLIEKRGKLAEVHTIQSLRPESIVQHVASIWKLCLLNVVHSRKGDDGCRCV